MHLGEGHVGVAGQLHLISFGRVGMGLVTVEPHLQRFSHVLDSGSFFSYMFIVWHFTAPAKTK